MQGGAAAGPPLQAGAAAFSSPEKSHTGIAGHRPAGSIRLSLFPPTVFPWPSRVCTNRRTPPASTPPTYRQLPPYGKFRAG